MKSPARILVIDDERGLRDFLSYELAQRGYAVDAASEGGEALAFLRERSYDLVISDVRMPGMDGLTLLAEIKRAAPAVEVVITTGYGTVETAVEAMKRGAFDFLLKPVEADRLAGVVARALASGEMRAMLAVYESSLALFRTMRLDAVLPVIVSLSGRLLGADRSIILLRSSDGTLDVAADSGSGPVPVLSDLRAGGTGAAREAAEPVLVQALCAGGEELGFLVFVRKPGGEPFSVQDGRHAAVFATQAAQAVANARLFHEVQAAQDRLIQSEKLNAMGRVVAGIAHEINNPLATILCGAQLVLDAGRLDAADRADLEDVVVHARRCRDIVRNLLEFSGKRESRRDELELFPILDSALEIARYGWKAPPPVARAWPGRSPRVRGDAVQLKQVMANLLRNAFQATEGREPSGVTVRVEERAGRVRVSVEDRGPGLPPDAPRRLFEPFFTTKAPGQGTGLGLYLCRLMIERHGGVVTAENREGGGAVFTVDLPALS